MGSQDTGRGHPTSPAALVAACFKAPLQKGGMPVSHPWASKVWLPAPFSSPKNQAYSIGPAEQSRLEAPRGGPVYLVLHGTTSRDVNVAPRWKLAQKDITSLQTCASLRASFNHQTRQGHGFESPNGMALTAPRPWDALSSQVSGVARNPSRPRLSATGLSVQLAMPLKRIATITPGSPPWPAGYK